MSACATIRLRFCNTSERQNHQSSKKARVYRKKMAEVLATQGARDQAEKIVAGLLKDDPQRSGGARAPRQFDCWRRAIHGRSRQRSPSYSR